jgi:hypothetical protein
VVSHIIGRSSSVMDDDDLEQAIWGELSIGVGYVMCHVTTINCDHNELPQRPSDVMWHAACYVTTVPHVEIRWLSKTASFLKFSIY